MSDTIRVIPNAVWSDPGIRGLEVSDREWRLDITHYRDFLEVATGISTEDELSASDCYRIGNRLQALVEERKKNDEWEPALVEEYPNIESLETFVWLARFFRACHDCHDASETCFSDREHDESPVPSH